MRALTTVKSNVRISLMSTQEDGSGGAGGDSRRLISGFFPALRNAVASICKYNVYRYIKKSGARKFLHISLDFRQNRTTIEVSPPIQFRIEWADSQGMSPLLGCRPI